MWDEPPIRAPSLRAERPCAVRRPGWPSRRVDAEALLWRGARGSENGTRTPGPRPRDQTGRSWRGPRPGRGAGVRPGRTHVSAERPDCTSADDRSRLDGAGHAYAKRSIRATWSTTQKVDCRGTVRRSPQAESGSRSACRTPARISYERTRAAWSWIAEATMSSSALVSAITPSRPPRTVSADPT